MSGPTFWMVLEGEHEGTMGAAGCSCDECAAAEKAGKVRLRFSDLTSGTYEPEQLQSLGSAAALDELVKRFSEGESMADLGPSGEHVVRWFVAMTLREKEMHKRMQQQISEGMERAFFALKQPPLEERS